MEYKINSKFFILSIVKVIKSLATVFFLIFFKYFIYLFLERGEERQRSRETRCVVASHLPPTGDLAYNPGMCPDWESNWWPFGLQASTQSTEPHQPGRIFFLITSNPLTLKHVQVHVRKLSSNLHILSFIKMLPSLSTPPLLWVLLQLNQFTYGLFPLLCYLISPNSDDDWNFIMSLLLSENVRYKDKNYALYIPWAPNIS